MEFTIDTNNFGKSTKSFFSKAKKHVEAKVLKKDAKIIGSAVVDTSKTIGTNALIVGHTIVYATIDSVKAIKNNAVDSAKEIKANHTFHQTHDIQF